MGIISDYIKRNCDSKEEYLYIKNLFKQLSREQLRQVREDIIKNNKVL